MAKLLLQTIQNQRSSTKISNRLQRITSTCLHFYQRVSRRPSRKLSKRESNNKLNHSHQSRSRYHQKDAMIMMIECGIPKFSIIFLTTNQNFNNLSLTLILSCKKKEKILNSPSQKKSKKKTIFVG